MVESQLLWCRAAAWHDSSLQGNRRRHFLPLLCCFKCLSPHTIPLTALWSLVRTLQGHTHTRHPGEGWDSQPHTVGCMHALPLFYCLLKAVKLKGGEKESIDRGVAISCEYLKSLAFSYFQQISVGLLHTSALCEVKAGPPPAL